MFFLTKIIIMGNFPDNFLAGICNPELIFNYLIIYFTRKILKLELIISLLIKN